jgi:site-specific recombinase XerC
MSRLGLRACEIARMRLHDVDWRSGELSVRGKGGRIDRLPLPAVISSFQDRHVVDLGGHVEDGVVDVTAVAA